MIVSRLNRYHDQVLSHLADLRFRSFPTFPSPITTDHHLGRGWTEALPTSFRCGTDLLPTLASDYYRSFPITCALIMTSSDHYWLHSALLMIIPDLLMTFLRTLMICYAFLTIYYDALRSLMMHCDLLWLLTFSYDFLRSPMIQLLIYECAILKTNGKV